jgi:hypothetical protein
MKRIVGLAIFLIPSISCVMASESVADRPTGVSAAEWVPVSDRLGIVLIKSEMVSASPQALLLRPPVSGYYMIKVGNGWTRLIIVEPLKGPADAG